MRCRYCGKSMDCEGVVEYSCDCGASFDDRDDPQWAPPVTPNAELSGGEAVRSDDLLGASGKSFEAFLAEYDAITSEGYVRRSKWAEAEAAYLRYRCFPPEPNNVLTVSGSEPDWKTMAIDCLHALRLMNAHYDDMSKSNPGFMGKLCLQRYDLWNEALLVSEGALCKYAHVPNDQAQRRSEAE